MKRFFPALIIMIPLLVLLSVPALAAPALPGFVSGSAIKAPYQASDSKAQLFLTEYNNPAKPSPYVVAVCNTLAIGLSPTQSLREESGQYQYLHFIRLGTASAPLQIYTFNNQPMSYGLTQGSQYPLDVLTFCYDTLTGTFDGGTLRKVPQGVCFDYIIDSSVLYEPTAAYPGYKRIGLGQVNNVEIDTPPGTPKYSYWLDAKSGEIPTYKVTVSYVYEDGRTAAATVTRSYQKGYAYSIVSPDIAGFYPDKSEIKGYMGQSDITVKVTYKENKAYEGKTKKLTIRYVFEDGTEAWTSNISNKTPGYLYSVISPRIPGYAADRAKVEGYMPGIDYTETVTYKRIESGQPDPPPYYYLTVNYLRRNGQMITREATLMLRAGADYYVRSPIFSYFKPDKLVVSGTMPERDVTVNVYYDETDSPNTGEGDKDDGTGGGSGGEGDGGSSSGSSGGSSGGGSGDGSGSNSGGSSSGGNDGSDSGGSGGGSSGGGSSSGSSSGGGSGGSGDSGGSSGSGSGGSDSSGGSSGSGNGDIGGCNCGGNSCVGSGCSCAGGGQFCPGGGYWRPGAGDFDNLFPNESEPDTNYPPLHLFDPDDFSYIAPSSSEYDPLKGVEVPKQMTRYPNDVPNISGGDPFPTPNVSGGDPFPTPNVSGGDPFPTPNVSGGDPFPTPNISGGDPFPTPNVSGGDPFPKPNISSGDPFPLPDLLKKSSFLFPF